MHGINYYPYILFEVLAGAGAARGSAEWRLRVACI